jgi:hypothetical protein
MNVLPNHSIPPVGLADRSATREHEKRCVGVVPQKEPHFLPPVQRSRHWEEEVGINYVPKSNEDVHFAQNRHFHTQALPELGAKGVLQIEVGFNPHVGPTQGHKGSHMKDPLGVKWCTSRLLNCSREQRNRCDGTPNPHS